MLKLLLMQCIKKGARVFIADFKGGVDFPKVWHDKCRMCITEESLLDTLDRLVAALENRKSEFAALGCPDIDSYNKIRRPLPRLIFAWNNRSIIIDVKAEALPVLPWKSKLVGIYSHKHKRTYFNMFKIFFSLSKIKGINISNGKNLHTAPMPATKQVFAIFPSK